MTEATVLALGVAFLAAIPPTLVALAGLRQGQKTNTENRVQSENIITQVEVVRLATNGNLDSLRADIKQLQTQLAEAHERILELQTHRRS